MTIAIYNRQRRIVGFATHSLRERAIRLDQAADTVASEVCVTLVSDAKIHELNRLWRSVDCPTDVLSFSQNEGEYADLHSEVLGDVIISLETADRQRGPKSILDEVTHLLIHGVLHLQGHDHVEDEEAAQMRSEEERLWRAVRR